MNKYRIRGLGGWRAWEKEKSAHGRSRQRVGRRNSTNCGLAQLHPIHTAFFNGPSVVSMLCCCCCSCTKDDYGVILFHATRCSTCLFAIVRCRFVARVPFSSLSLMAFCFCFTSQATGYVNLPAYYLSSRCIFGDRRGEERMRCSKALIVCSTGRTENETLCQL